MGSEMCIRDRFIVSSAICHPCGAGAADSHYMPRGDGKGKGKGASENGSIKRVVGRWFTDPGDRKDNLALATADGPSALAPDDGPSASDSLRRLAAGIGDRLAVSPESDHDGQVLSSLYIFNRNLDVAVLGGIYE